MENKSKISAKELFIGIIVIISIYIIIPFITNIFSPSQIDTIINDSFDLDDFIERCSVKANDKNFKKLNKMYDDLINQFNKEHNEIINEYKQEIEEKEELIELLQNQIEDLGYEPYEL